ncbi:LamG domain-containing protein [Streptomyces sp. NPDC002055]|uniref:LamG domain-containing protein n=1 Tax=Streptomyces sp. NPDC002055 TaxID=3154534 RepID=UPI0033324E87
MRRTATMVGVLTALLAAGGTGLPDTGTPVPAGAASAAPAKTPSGRYAKVQQTEEQAQVAAEAGGNPVEVAALRQERREVLANPDGSFTAYEYTEPVRTVRDGRWVPVDDALVRRADGSWGPKAATVDLRFSNGGEEPFVRMRKAGREYALTWRAGKLPAPKVEGSTATYPDVLPGVDLVTRAEVDGLAHLLVVKTPEAARNPELKKIEFGLRTQGLTVEETADGSLRAVDAAVGGTVFEGAEPVMWDSADTGPQAGPSASARPGKAPSGAPAARAARPASASRAAADPSAERAVDGPGAGGRTAPVDVEVTGDRLSLTPDRSLLTGEDTVFPVVIDPVQRTTSRTAWTGVMSGMPTEADWKYKGSAGAGKCPTDYNPVSCNGVGVRRLLYTLPTSFYRGKSILEASFSARVEHVYHADARAEPISLYRIGGKNYTVTAKSNWSNTKDDWNDRLLTVDRKIQPTSCGAQPNLHFEGGELLKELQTAADGDWSSMSLGLRATNEDTFGGWKRICGKAHLSVKYNKPPKRIDVDWMSSNPGKECTWGSGRPFTDERPKLRTQARDPDHTSYRTEQVKVEFKVDWTRRNGSSDSYTATTKFKAPNEGTSFDHTVKKSVISDLKPGSVIYWSARAHDHAQGGPWSYDGGAQRCEFIYDATVPGAPGVVSKAYPDDGKWHDGVGTVGSFTFAPNTDDSIDDKDVTEYRYSFDKEPMKPVAAKPMGGPATVSWTPMKPGRHTLTVEAYDRAKHSSSSSHHWFLVTEGRPVAGQWNLADERGAGTAHDETLDHPATAGPGVEFGVPGPGGTADFAARFDGTENGYLDAEAGVLDSDTSFSVSAWVRPTALDHDMAVVSQNGTGEPGFTLGYDAGLKSWAFSAPVGDVSSLGSWQAKAGVVPVKDQWVLLTGVYDAHAAGGPEMRIHVNQQVQGTAKRRSVWKARGDLQIGRATAPSGYRDPFQGDLAEVRAFDRVLSPEQVAEQMTVKPQRKGYWPLDSAANGTSADAQQGGQPLTLGGDATVYRSSDPLAEPPLVGAGHLTLDGAGDWAATAAPPVNGTSSFTITARAQLTSLDAEKSQTVFSLPGSAADRVAVRYDASSGRWQLAVARENKAGAKVTSVTDDRELPDTGGAGQHLAVVYDAFANRLRLYVEGQLATSASAADTTLWAANGGLQIGRSAQGGGREHFAGALDEVRVYSGAADPAAVARMAEPVPAPGL